MCVFRESTSGPATGVKLVFPCVGGDDNCEWDSCSSCQIGSTIPAWSLLGGITIRCFTHIIMFSFSCCFAFLL